jgi:hypothetical protein
MSIRNKEIIDIEAGNPFGNCQLDRKKYADVLTKIVSTYADGFVLAINNKWGTGKTTFVKMWERELKDKNFQTVYFNSWENDFENNALTALMGELKTLKKEEEDNINFTNALKNAAVFTKNLAPVLVKAVMKKYIGESYSDLAEGVTKSIGDIFEKDVNEYADKKKSIKEFRESLSKFIADTWQGKPVIFIIDELDRCRPDYAVSILEQIKHFFSIPNIVFVLSIDKVQLGHAVRGVYGSENIDADEYLRRFIDIEYSIPEPDVELYVKHLYEYYGFDDFFRMPDRTNLHSQNYEIQQEKDNFIKLSIILFKNSKLTLRQQEKVFSNARLSLKSFPFNHFVYPQIYVYLNFIRVINNPLFRKIKNKEIKLEELQNEFMQYCKLKDTADDTTFLIYMESYIVHFYNNYTESYEYKNPLYKKNQETGKNELLIKSLTDKSEDQIDFLNCIEFLNNKARLSGDFLNNVMDKIDLLDSIKE